MPKLTGIFSSFDDLENLQASDLNQYLKIKEQASYLENFIGNRILYPQVIPINLNDLNIDLAILRAYIKKNPGLIYLPKLGKIVLEEEFVIRFPPLTKLIEALLDVLDLGEVSPIEIRKFNDGAERVGTVIRAHALESESFKNVNVNGQVMELEVGSIAILPNKDPQILVQIANQSPLNVAGGTLGVIIDLQKG